MGSSFIEYRGYGFWSHDPFIERFAAETAGVIESQVEKQEWEIDLSAHWILQASGVFGGCIHLKLDDFLVSEERRRKLRQIAQSVTEQHAPDDPIHQTGILLLRLLDGQLKTDSSSPLGYMVGRNKPGETKV